MIPWRRRPTLAPFEVAEITGLSLEDVLALVDDGTLGAITVRSKLLVLTADVREVFRQGTKVEAFDADVVSLVATLKDDVA